MDNERCTDHGVTRCSTCAFLEAKKNKTKPPMVQPIVVAPPSTKVSVPPPDISNAPPEDIEMMDAHETHKAREAYDKELEALLEAKARQESINKQADDIAAEISASPPHMPVGTGPLPGPEPSSDVTGFDTLPVDDSHSSKVIRAAAEYADAARDYAIKLASYTKVAETIKKAAERLTEAAIEKDLKEKALKDLVAGGDK